MPYLTPQQAPHDPWPPLTPHFPLSFPADGHVACRVTGRPLSFPKGHAPEIPSPMYCGQSPRCPLIEENAGKYTIASIRTVPSCRLGARVYGPLAHEWLRPPDLLPGT